MGLPACQAPKPLRRNRSRERTTRIARMRDRNRMRKTLFILKGRPSTSPYCTWINDPLEPEQLPPDWRPPPQPPPGAKDPPF